MSIKTLVDELDKIQTEIKRNNATNKILRQRSTEIENNIALYLQQKNEPGLKYNGRAIIIENKEKRAQKSQKDKKTDVIELLKHLGVNEPNAAYEKIIDAQKKDPISEQKIKLKKIKNSF